LGISSRPEYRKRYKDDPRLPSQPHEFYKEKGWIGLPNFFGRETPDFYHTYEEAKEAVMKSGISSYKEYHKRYKKDPRLPCKPNEIYQGKGWTDWYDLLGRETPDFYETYEEAKNAVVKLGINSKSEYRTRYKENPKLPSNPQRIYKNKGWIESAYFFGKTKK
ncbi:MAG: integrase, partial [Candidatus Scalindua sp.]|nr:integrase [Candidatus Scalindua sp.]